MKDVYSIGVQHDKESLVGYGGSAVESGQPIPVEGLNKTLAGIAKHLTFKIGSDGEVWPKFIVLKH